MATMNISLPEQMKDWVEQQVATGRYANASDYVRDVLRRDQERLAAYQTLDTVLEGALASGISDRGPDELMKVARERAKRHGRDRNGSSQNS